jgi:hypothetical protein
MDKPDMTYEEFCAECMKRGVFRHTFHGTEVQGSWDQTTKIGVFMVNYSVRDEQYVRAIIEGRVPTNLPGGSWG